MIYKQTTQVPNIFFDQLLPTLTEAEIKLLLVIIRQTYGWIDPRTGKRKQRDRISRKQFVVKTGLCKRVISTALQSLVTKGIISITCQLGNSIPNSLKRKGIKLYYSLELGQILPSPRAQKLPGLGHISDLIKTNYTKEIKTKLKRSNGVKSIGEIINHMPIAKCYEKSS
jgi:hypothetical protein